MGNTCFLITSNCKIKSIAEIRVCSWTDTLQLEKLNYALKGPPHISFKRQEQRLKASLSSAAALTESE